MSKQFKVGLYLLVLCAACLFAGKCLRMFTKVNMDAKEGTKGGDTDMEENENTQTGETDIFTEEQREALGDFSGGGYTIVLDAGHGAFDPGKVGVNGAKEKEINLSIAKKLQTYLHAAGFTVHMTRESDEALYGEGDSNKKSADMRSRIRTIEEKKPEFAVSIHQNSFTQESSFGAQVFYYESSKQGKTLAEYLQTTIKTVIADENHREATANESYYLLRKSPCPMVIVECGFLSNPREAELLVTEEYQDKMAWAICFGIVEYCKSAEELKGTEGSADGN
jgi:N-acetylmuramoyl-L-alanine amidase